VDKVTPINEESYSPRIILSELMEKSDSITDILALIRDEEGDWNISYSNIGLEQLCLISRLLDEHVRTRMKDFIVDTKF